MLTNSYREPSAKLREQVMPQLKRPKDYGESILAVDEATIFLVRLRENVLHRKQRCGQPGSFEDVCNDTCISGTKWRAADYRRKTFTRSPDCAQISYQAEGNHANDVSLREGWRERAFSRPEVRGIFRPRKLRRRERWARKRKYERPTTSWIANGIFA